MKKKLVLTALLSCIATLVVTGIAAYYMIYEPFNVKEVNVETRAMTGDSLKAEANDFNYQKSQGSIDYMRKGFEFDLSSSDEYCKVVVTVEVYNPSILTTSALYLVPKKDNDVICYLEPSQKAVSVPPGESKEVSSYFVCRKNGMTDKELTEYIGGLDFYLLEEDNIFGRKKVKVTLKSFN